MRKSLNKVFIAMAVSSSVLLTGCSVSLPYGLDDIPYIGGGFSNGTDDTDVTPDGGIGSGPEDPDATVVTDNVIDCDLFELTMPDDLAGLFEAQVSEDSISIYHKESVDAGFGGHVFTVWARKIPLEFSGGPYIKVGEIVDKDGNLYDVVEGLPSEVQWDYNEEEPADFEALDNAKNDIIAGIKGINGATYMHGAGMKGEDLYSYRLKIMYEDVKNAKDASELEEKGYSPEYYVMTDGGKDMSAIGYGYFDVNLDGIDELFVGDKETGMIFDIYTITDRDIAQVVSGSARNRYGALSSGFIINEYSSGADESGWSVYNLESNSTEMVLQWAVKYDGYTDSKNPWFLSYDLETWEPISEKDEESEEERIADRKDLALKPLSDFEDRDFANEDLSKYDTFTQLVGDLTGGMGYANVTLGDTDVLLVSSGCFNNEGQTAAIDSSIFMYNENGKIVYLGKVSSCGTAYPLAISDGCIYIGSHHDVLKETVKDGELVIVEEAFEEFYRDGSVSYMYGSSDGKYSTVEDDSYLTALFDELSKSEVIEYSEVN